MFKHRNSLLDAAAEKQRYLAHNNNVEDPGYRKFVLPIVEKIIAEIPKQSIGLDYGAGPGPVIAKILTEKGYSLQLYDPIFQNDLSVLNSTYDYIVCCEVMEHFKDPNKEFTSLKELLKEGGKLYCMTGFLPEETKFEDWYYKNDPTHIVFYSQTSVKWIKENFGFSNFSIENRLIIFSN